MKSTPHKKTNVAPVLIALGLLTTAASTRSQSFSPVFEGATFLGGAGDQRGTAIAVSGGAAFVCGSISANGNDGLVARYALPVAAGATPVWSNTWPGRTGYDDFAGACVSSEGVYVAGRGFNRTSDTVGDKEPKGIVVKFSLSGAAGGGFGGAIWDRQTPSAPGAFPYGGDESLHAEVLAVENGTNFIYVTGRSQSGFFNGGRLYVSKLAEDSTILWTRNDGAEQVGNAYNIGLGLAILNGNVYVAGRNEDSGPGRAYLRKYSPDGALEWARTSSVGFQYNGVTALGGAIYAVGTTTSGGSTADFLIEKWDEAGNTLWSRVHDRNSAEDILSGVVGAGGRIYAVGSTRENTTGGADAILLEIDTNTGTVVGQTLYGGSQDDFANSVAFDGSDLYVVGETRSFGEGGNELMLLRYSLRPVLTTLVVTPPNPTVRVGQTQQFTAIGTFSDGTSSTLGDLRWSSSNPSVATIDSGGLATAIGPGTTIITATSAGISGNTTLLVVQILEPCQAIGELIALIQASDTPRHNKRPLIASLEAACASIERSDFVPAANQLQAFQNKVRAQVGLANPTLADTFLSAVQAIIDSLRDH